MKRAVVFLLAVVLFSALLLTGCGSNDTNAHPLVGAWLRDGSSITLIFNANGTLTLDSPVATHEFVWTVDSGTVFIEDRGAIDELEFQIHGDILIMTNASGIVRSYTRVE